MVVCIAMFFEWFVSVFRRGIGGSKEGGREEIKHFSGGQKTEY